MVLIIFAFYTNLIHTMNNQRNYHRCNKNKINNIRLYGSPKFSPLIKSILDTQVCYSQTIHWPLMNQQIPRLHIQIL